MNKDAQKTMMFLVIAGIILVAVNAMVWIGAKSGRLGPIDNVPLWSVFVVLNTCSLLWAISLLGLQPMVVAVSYMAGAFLAYQGVKLIPEVNIAEATTAGATYGAFGALVVGNVGTKVRLAFFQKAQIPFVFVIAALLVVDAFLNSRISNAGWNVILNALVFPFILAGVILGLLWVVVVGFGIGHGASRSASAVQVNRESPTLAKETVQAVEKPVFQQPERTKPEAKKQVVVAKTPKKVATPPEKVVAPTKKVATPPKKVATPEKVATQPEKVVAPPKKVAATYEAVVPVFEEEPAVVEEEVTHDHFFPLEIDKDDDFILPMDDTAPMDAIPMGMAAFDAEEEPDVDVEPVLFQSVAEDVRVLEREAEPVVEKEVHVEPVPETKSKKGSEDWLSGHLELLKKINK